MKDWYVYHDAKRKTFEAKQMNNQGLYFTTKINEDVIRKNIEKDKANIYARLLNKQGDILK